MTGAIAVLLMLGLVFYVIFGGHTRTWSTRRAETRIRSTSGPNFTSVLAAVAAAGIILKLAQLPFVSGVPGLLPALVSLAVVLVIGIVLAGSLTRLLIGLISVGLLVVSVGFGGALQLIVLVVFMGALLSVARGWLA